MYEVVAQRLWVGHARDARDARAIFNAGIEAVVDLAYEEPVADLPRSLVYCRVPLIDGSGNNPQLLQLAVLTVARLIAGESPTLVACGAGMSRSPAIVAAALSSVRKAPPEACLKQLAESHPHDVSQVLWRDLLAAIASQ